MRKIDPKALDKNVFSAIGDQWMLITAGSDDHGAFGKEVQGIAYYMGAVKIDETELVLGDLT